MLCAETKKMRNYRHNTHAKLRKVRYLTCINIFFSRKKILPEQSTIIAIIRLLLEIFSQKDHWYDPYALQGDRDKRHTTAESFVFPTGG